MLTMGTSPRGVLAARRAGGVHPGSKSVTSQMYVLIDTRLRVLKVLLFVSLMLKVLKVLQFFSLSRMLKVLKLLLFSSLSGA